MGAVFSKSTALRCRKPLTYEKCNAWASGVKPPIPGQRLNQPRTTFEPPEISRPTPSTVLQPATTSAMTVRESQRLRFIPDTTILRVKSQSSHHIWASCQESASLAKPRGG